MRLWLRGPGRVRVRASLRLRAGGAACVPVRVRFGYVPRAPDGNCDGVYVLRVVALHICSLNPLPPKTWASAEGIILGG